MINLLQSRRRHLVVLSCTLKMVGELGVAKKWTKSLNIKIFKWEAEIVLTFPSLNSKIFGFSHWLLIWPRTSPANFWVRAQRKTAQNSPKNAIFQNLLYTHPKLENARNKCLFRHFGRMLAWESCLCLWFGALEVPFLGAWTWAFLAKIIKKAHV